MLTYALVTIKVLKNNKLKMFRTEFSILQGLDKYLKQQWSLLPVKIRPSNHELEPQTSYIKQCNCILNTSKKQLQSTVDFHQAAVCSIVLLLPIVLQQCKI